MVVLQFQAFVNDFNGGTTETNQFLYDITNWLKIKAPVEDNPLEDPCDKDDDEISVKEGTYKKPNWLLYFQTTPARFHFFTFLGFCI